MKAQGLPINFIVIAALAILILILAAGFVVAGAGSFGGAIGPDQIKTTCNSHCLTLQNVAKNYDNSTFFASGVTTAKYCSLNATVKGYGNGNCVYFKDTLGTTCTVTFGDMSSCMVTCSSSDPGC